MKDTKTFKYKSSLARKMSAGGGCSIAEAVAKADSGLEAHRAAAMQSMADRVAGLEALCSARTPGAETNVYEQAAALLDMAGFFDTGPLYKACFSLCELSDHLTVTGAWNWPSIGVHVQALRLILTDDCKETDQSRLVLEGLATIQRRFSTQSH